MTTSAGVVVLILAIGDIHGFVDFKQPNAAGSRWHRRGLVSGEWKLTSNDSNDSNNNNNMNCKQEMESSFVQSRGGRDYGDVIPSVDWNTVIYDNKTKKENSRRPAKASLINNPTSSREDERGAGHKLFFAASNKESTNQPRRSPRPPLTAPNNDIHSTFHAITTSDNNNNNGNERSAIDDDNDDGSSSGRWNALPIIQHGEEWSAYYDIQSGLVFYYNEITSISTWDVPYENFPCVTMNNEDTTVGQCQPGALEMSNSDETSPATATTTARAVPVVGGNISMERALGYIGMDDWAEALKWEEVKSREERAINNHNSKAIPPRNNDDDDVRINSTSSRKGVGQALQWEEDNRWERTRRREDNMWERARRKAIQQREEEDARNINNISSMTVSNDASETGNGRATKSTTMTTSKKGSSKIVMIYEATKRSELEGIDQARIVASTVEEQKWKDENESSMVKIDELGAENFDTAVPIQKDEEEVNTKEFDKERVSGGVGGLLSNWWGRLRTPIKTKSLYDILDCPPDATREQLKRSYLSLARETHPDAVWQKSGMTANVDTNEEKNIIADDNESKTIIRKFTEISHAWKILGDSSSRRRYDRELQARGVTDTAAFLFEGLVMGAARTLDAVLASAENNL